MTTPPQQDAPTMFYPLNPCGHLRGPGGGCIGSPECKREPVSADKLGSWCNVLENSARGSWPILPRRSRVKAARPSRTSLGRR